MKIEINFDVLPARVTLLAPEDFTGLSVVTVGDVAVDALADAAAGVGRLEPGGEHVFLDVEQLRRLAGDLAGDPAWLADLDAMLAYAAKKGWVAQDGTVRAHVERPS